MQRHAVGFLVCGALCTVAIAQSPGLAAEGPRTVDYNRDIRPILSKNCYGCHGPDDEHRKAGLRLDRREAALGQLESGEKAIVPGQVQESELYQRVTATEEAELMPPAGSGHQLAPAQIELLKLWIEQGAPFAEHWSFVKPVRAPLPAVRDQAWPRNGLDHFILARLESMELKPSAEADRYALIRRVSLDLRGMPPSWDEVDAFVRDASGDAYERLADRFLNDTSYGERWARIWLDQSRYADSMGYGSDPLRTTIWRFRDWVIDAFNRNVPFDQFTKAQIAGDLFPKPTLDDLIATAFHRNTMTNTEGGTDDEEFRVAAVKDRVNTTMQVWMGLTMGCAQCHNHKYEPITQEEYYRFYAYFNQSADADRGDEAPTIPAPTPAMQEQTRRIDAQIAALKPQIQTSTPELVAAQAAWESQLGAAPVWQVLEIAEAQSESGASLQVLPDHSVLASGAVPDNDLYRIDAKTSAAGITAFRLEALPDPSLPNAGSGRSPDGNFVLSRFSVAMNQLGAARSPTARFVRIELPGNGKILSLAEVQVSSGGENIARRGKATQSSVDYEGPPERAIDGNTNGDYVAAKSTTHTQSENDPWWELDLGADREVDLVTVWNRTDGDVGSRLTGYRLLLLDATRKTVWQPDAPELPKPNREFATSGVRAVPLTYAAADYSQQNFAVSQALNPKDLAQNGWAVGPEVQKPHAAIFVPASPLAAEGEVLLTTKLEHRFKTAAHTLGRFRLSVTNDTSVIQRSKVPVDILAIVDTSADQRTDEQRTKLAEYYRSIAPALQPVRDEIAKIEKSRPAIPAIPTMQELPESGRRSTHIMVKGNFLSPGREVSAALPAALHPMPPGAPQNRLGVADWLVDIENPLTARVAVNRFWAQIFGIGLVETEEDFGTQGELPSHPELLDWLAVEFMNPSPAPLGTGAPRGWDMKALLRLIVTSAAYRQTSLVTPELLEKDPRNRFLSRGPRFRLEAEMVRDQALALSGLLSRKTHGPSVYPPQPPGLWQAAFNGQRTWATSDGEDRYRRGLYTFWRRTVPYPSMVTFDAPSREICAVRRIRTNTPLQAFVTLNDPVYVEASQALARRILREGGSTTEERARYALRLCLSRPAQQAQVQSLLALHETELKHYRDEAQAAIAMATEPLGALPEGMDSAEAAAWTVIANVLLNLDAVLTKG